MHVEDSKEASAARKQFVERRVRSESTAAPHWMALDDTPNVGHVLYLFEKKSARQAALAKLLLLFVARS